MGDSVQQAGFEVCVSLSEFEESDSLPNMEHPVQIVAKLFEPVDFLLREYGHLLFLGLVHLSIIAIAWLCARKPRHNGSQPNGYIIYIPLIARKPLPLQHSPFGEPLSDVGAANSATEHHTDD